MSSSPVVPYRPQLWNNRYPLPATVMVTYPGQQGTPQYIPSGIGATLPATKTTYIFDCVIQADHEQRLRKTEHPVQTGAAISDHAFIEPSSLTLDIGMSDAMDSFSNVFLGTSASKSVSAYQTMILLMFSRQPLTITTRLRTYSNMIVESVRPQESAKTIAGLRMRVEFGEIFRADVQVTPLSTRGNDTKINNLGSTTCTPLTPAQLNQNSVTGVQNVGCYPNTAKGGGFFTSTPVANLQDLPNSK